MGCYGATKVQTPNIDKLAAEGRRFTDASPSAVCTPSRCGLLTTFASITGQEVEPDQMADSLNVLPALIGDTESVVLASKIVITPLKKHPEFPDEVHPNILGYANVV